MQSKIPEVVIVAIASSILILAFLAFIIFMILEFNKRQNDLTNNIRILELNQEKNILNAQLEIQEETFRQISQEIHDNISLSLTLAKLNLNTFSLQNNGTTPNMIESSIDLISKALADLNDISKSMDADLISSHGLISALQYEAELIRKAGIHDIQVEVEGDPIYLESSKELLVFRMIQEACNNILKHAQADQIRIRLHYKKNALAVGVCDNGKGFDLESLSGFNPSKRSSGLKNIRNRASLMHASVDIQSDALKGTRLHILIPIDVKDENS
jgi:signal transduction histidine kinase